MALDRSGSMTQSTARIGPGRDGPGLGVAGVGGGLHGALRLAAASRRSCRCAASTERALPSWWTVMPSSKRGGREQQPGDELRGTRGIDGDGAAAQRAGAVHGERSASPSISSTEACAGRRGWWRAGGCWACSSPSNATSPVGQCGGGRQESHDGAGEPAVDRGAAQRAGVTASVSASPSISMPRARRASIMRSVSRLRRAPVSVDGPSASAARISARLVMDFDPGRVTVAWTGTSIWGAGQKLTSPSWLMCGSDASVVRFSAWGGVVGGA